VADYLERLQDERAGATGTTEDQLAFDPGANEVDLGELRRPVPLGVHEQAALHLQPVQVEQAGAAGTAEVELAFDLGPRD